MLNVLENYERIKMKIIIEPTENVNWFSAKVKTIKGVHTFEGTKNNLNYDINYFLISNGFQKQDIKTIVKNHE